MIRAPPPGADQSLGVKRIFPVFFAISHLGLRALS